MPKLLQIDTCCGIGSTGKIAEIIGSIGKSKGWDCYLAHSARFAGKTQMIPVDIGNKIEEYFHYVVSLLFDRHGLASFRATNRLIRKIKTIRPDVVHIHNVHGYYVNFEILLGYLSRHNIPTVITLHDFWLMTGHCAYINKSCDKWTNGCGCCGRLKEYPKAILDNTKCNWKKKAKIFSKFDYDKLCLVPVSNWLASYTKESLLGGKMIVPIPNGVDTNIFRPYKGEPSEIISLLDKTKFTVLSVADRWTDSNGLQDIISLSQQKIDGVQFVVLGLSESQIGTLPKTIIGLRRTSSVKQLTELYTYADVFLNVSREVTFGLVTAEAMACETPAIVLKGTAGEEIINEDTGFVANDLNHVITIIRSIQNNKDIINRSKCRERIIDCFNADQQYTKYFDVYNSIMQ